MTEAELKKHLNGKTFSKLYVIWGDEKKYVKSYSDKLVEKIMGKNPSDFNYHEFSNDFDINNISLCIMTVPFMEEYNFVKISDMDSTQLLKDDFNSLIKTLKNIPDGSVVLFTMPTLIQDGKKLGNFNKILDEANKNGVVCEFNKMGDMALEKHLSVLATRQNVFLSRINADKIISYCGNDLTNLTNELDKMCAYVGDGNEITSEVIDLLATKNLEAKVFSLADNIVNGKSDEAMKILETLFYQQEEPIAILSVLTNAYVDFYRGRIATECGVKIDDVAKAFDYRNRAFVLKKRTKLSTDALGNSLDALVDADRKIKSYSTDRKLILEELVFKLLVIAKKRN